MSTFSEVFTLLRTARYPLLSPISLAEFYHKSDPIVSAVFFMCCVTAFVYLAWLVTGNMSFVDMLWSILPCIYAVHFAYHTKDERATLIAAMIVMWGTRLTWNLWLKGGYSLEFEDYRFTRLKKSLSPVMLHLFNLFFVAIFQNVLLMAIATPVYFVTKTASSIPIGVLDYILAGLLMSFWAIESAADWTLRQFRQRRKKRTFYRQGLFRYSRHPNFFGELGIWTTVYLFSLVPVLSRLLASISSGNGIGKFSPLSLLNWSAIGTIALDGVFFGSIGMTENIEVEKYPDYREYQRTTSCLFPWFPSKSAASSSSPSSSPRGKNKKRE